MTLDDVLTVSEASQLYGVDVSMLRRACTGQKGYPPLFQSGECRQSAKTWRITQATMDRVYKKRYEKEK